MHGVHEAAGSNPVSPTTTGKPDKIKCYTLCMIINKGMNFIAKVRPLKQLKELGKIEGKYKITGYDDNEREAHALQSKEEILNAFAKYSGDNREALESILKKFPYITDPYNIYLNLKEIEARTKKNVFLALSMWDFNGCLSQDRDGYSRTETFVPVLKEVISEQIKRLGSFVVVSASTSEQMAYHMKKEKDIAKNIIIATENGRGWLVPMEQDDGQIKLVEFQKPLKNNQKMALDRVSEILEKLCEIMRKNELIAFVNKQKFSKCTMEGAGNGKDWYETAIKQLLLPYLQKNGAIWDGNPKEFSFENIRFNVSPTVDTWEIDIIEASEGIGKVTARQILQNSISDIWEKQEFVKQIHWERSGGDSFKWDGSDVGLTDPDYIALPFAVSGDSDPLSSLDLISENVQYGRKFWPIYDNNRDGKIKLTGYGMAAANYMKTVLDIVPCVEIPIEVLKKYLTERLQAAEGFVKTGRVYDLDDDIVLYDFPNDISEKQKQIFLKAGSDVSKDPEEQSQILKKIRKLVGLDN